MSVSTHVLDATTGRPAVGMQVRFETLIFGRWTAITRRADDADAAPAGIAVTDADGRIADLAGDPGTGDYRLIFDVDTYFAGATFYPEVVVTFRITDPAAHHHVPLLLSPYAYSTYRGS